MWKVIWVWQMEIFNLDLVWRQFWNSEIRKFLAKQPVFMQCLLSAICWARCKTTSVSIYFCSFFVLILLNLLYKIIESFKLFSRKKINAMLWKNLKLRVTYIWSNRWRSVSISWKLVMIPKISPFQNSRTTFNLHISICRTQITFHISIWDAL